MLKELEDLLKEKKAIIWISGRYEEELLNLVKESLNSYEEKKVFLYSNKKTLDLESNETQKKLNTLNECLDTLYPLGIKKVPIFLIIQGSYDELNTEENIKLLKEIFEMKEENSKYNFTIIILERNKHFENIQDIITFLEIKDTKEKNCTKDWVEEYIKEYADKNNLKLQKNNIDKILVLFENLIKNVISKNSEKKNTYKYMINVPLTQIEHIANLEVCKYPITYKMWKDIMGVEHRNREEHKTDHIPVTNITWWETLEFCNKLSEKFSLMPVYDLSIEGKLKINQIDGTTVEPSEADFFMTEGFRLPTYYEFFLFSDLNNLEPGVHKVDNKKRYSNYWSPGNRDQYGEVGRLKANKYGIYDCTSEIGEWLFGTPMEEEDEKEFYSIGTYFNYDSENPNRIVSEGSIDEGLTTDNGGAYGKGRNAKITGNTLGFRIVRSLY